MFIRNGHGKEIPIIKAYFNGVTKFSGDALTGFGLHGSIGLDYDSFVIEKGIMGRLIQEVFLLIYRKNE